MSTDIEVALDMNGETVHVGLARLHRRRGRITTDFTYNSAYLARRDAYAIDPALYLDSGRGVVEGLPGAFKDCAPDRWGRRLVDKRFAASQTPGQTPRGISDIDYLLGVSDITRQGALRFRPVGADDFVDTRADVPRMIRLPALLHAADETAKADSDSDLKAVQVLLDAGSGSLGGARPKASVMGDDGLLYIAKFPHHDDEWDVMAWEKTALDLAQQAGIEVPHTRITKINGRTVLLLERFDRANGHRIGYMSALTMVQGKDNDGGDYVDFAADLADVSASADADLKDLWRRIAFSVAIHNTDDHFRNHGFLRLHGGWRFSPLFDVNPNPDMAKQRVTSIGGATARPDEIDALMSYAADFGLDEKTAVAVLRQVSDATREWRQIASLNGIFEAEQKRFEGAFEGLRDDMDSRTIRAVPPLAKGALPKRAHGQSRRKTSRKSTSGSFATPERDEAIDIVLDQID